MMQQTSLIAYEEIKSSLNRKELSVLRMIACFDEHGCTDFELSRLLNWPINCVTGRRNSLVKKKCVEEIGLKTNEMTGKLNILWATVV